MSVLRIIAIVFLIVSQLSIAQEREVELVPVNFNTENNEFAIRKLNNSFVFVGTAKDEFGNLMYDPKTKEAFTDLFILEDTIVSDFKIDNSDGLSVLASSYFFDGPISASENGDIIFFTNNVAGRKEKQTLGIFYTIKTAVGYSDPIAFSFNSDEYNTTHPFFDEASGYLYFSSDISSGKGGMDVYRAKWENNTLSKIDTLQVNSDSNDLFPYVYNEKLYISSNRVGSSGGYDIFEIVDNNSSALQYPFNTEADDLAILWLSDTTGFITSNRLQSSFNTTALDDNIYRFRVILPEEPVVSIDIELVDEDGNPIEAALLTVTEDASGVIKFSALTDKFGKIEGTVDTLAKNESNAYTINITKEGFIFQEQTLNVTPDDTSSLSINSGSIDPKPEVLVSEMELSDALDIETIYYDFNSSALRPSATKELDKLVKFLNEHPEVTIELGSHTDCVGSDKYNLWLSERRAASAAKYVQDRIEVSSKLISKGYGENIPVVTCNCKGKTSSCSDSENQRNRRTEFKITGVKLSNTSK